MSGLSDIDPAFALFEIPMFFESYDELFHVLEGMGPELEARLEAEGYVLLHWAHAGWIYFFTAEPVASYELGSDATLDAFCSAVEGRL